MLRFKKKTDPILELVEQAIEDVAKEMISLNSDSDEYAKMNKQLAELIVTRTKLQSTGKIGPEIWMPVAANLAGILLIMNHERVNVIATKALGQVTKLKI